MMDTYRARFVQTALGQLRGQNMQPDTRHRITELAQRIEAAEHSNGEMRLALNALTAKVDRLEQSMAALRAAMSAGAYLVDVDSGISDVAGVNYAGTERG